MKIKSLTPWFNLYSSELKYNIQLVPSLHRVVLNSLFYLAIAVFSLTLFLGYKLWLGLLIVFTALIVILSYLQASKRQQSKWLTRLTAKHHLIRSNFVLTDSGACQFVGQAPLQLSANSQINLWGYWLIFSTSDDGFSKCFIFKDSLTGENQSRLARTIMRVQKSRELNH